MIGRWAIYIDRIELSFDAGHRILNYQGKCAQPHGHTYRAEVFAGVRQLNDLGLGIDFGDLKSGMRDWINANWDHAFLLNDADASLVAALRTIPESKLYLFPGENPSAETMARQLFEQARCSFGDIVQRVRIWESSTQYAEYLPGDDLPRRQYSQEERP